MWYNSDLLKRLARILFNALTALSLLLFATTVVLWVRSYRTDDTLTLTRNSLQGGTVTKTERSLLTGNGAIRYALQRMTTTGVSAPDVARRMESSEVKGDRLGLHADYSANPTEWLERSTINGLSGLLGSRWGSASLVLPWDDRTTITRYQFIVPFRLLIAVTAAIPGVWL